MDPKEELKTLIDVYAYKSLLSGKRFLRILGTNAIIMLSITEYTFKKSTTKTDCYSITLLDSDSKQTDIILEDALIDDKKERLERFLTKHTRERWYCTTSHITSDVIDNIIKLLNDPHLFDDSGVMTKAAR